MAKDEHTRKRKSEASTGPPLKRRRRDAEGSPREIDPEWRSMSNREIRDKAVELKQEAGLRLTVKEIEHVMANAPSFAAALNTLLPDQVTNDAEHDQVTNDAEHARRLNEQYMAEGVATRSRLGSPSLERHTESCDTHKGVFAESWLGREKKRSTPEKYDSVATDYIRHGQDSRRITRVKYNGQATGHVSDSQDSSPSNLSAECPKTAEQYRAEAERIRLEREQASRARNCDEFHNKSVAQHKTSATVPPLKHTYQRKTNNATHDVAVDLPLLYHESQAGLLCGAHAINSLLQGPYFAQKRLNAFAEELDRMEHDYMLEGTQGAESEHYISFSREKSGNFSRSGNYSVQVLEMALLEHNLSLTHIDAEDASHVRDDLATESAFICHRRSHWFAVRKIDGKWFNLDSMLKAPVFLPDVTYLKAFLRDTKRKGYNLFVVIGTCPLKPQSAWTEDQCAHGSWKSPVERGSQSTLDEYFSSWPSRRAWNRTPRRAAAAAVPKHDPNTRKERPRPPLESACSNYRVKKSTSRMSTKSIDPAAANRLQARAEGGQSCSPHVSVNSTTTHTTTTWNVKTPKKSVYSASQKPYANNSDTPKIVCKHKTTTGASCKNPVKSDGMCTLHLNKRKRLPAPLELRKVDSNSAQDTNTAAPPRKPGRAKTEEMCTTLIDTFGQSRQSVEDALAAVGWDVNRAAIVLIGHANDTTGDGKEGE